MKKRKIVKSILLVLLVAFVAIQFIPIDRSVPEYDPNDDFLAGIEAPESIKSLVKNVCYDCHSYQTTYPWYANVAPISFWLQSHMNEAKEHFNFSEWATYTVEDRDHSLEEMAEEVEEGEMPFYSYRWVHPEARLTDAQRNELAGWFEGLR